jgi:hypothetical protein
LRNPPSLRQSVCFLELPTVIATARAGLGKSIEIK